MSKPKPFKSKVRFTAVSQCLRKKDSLVGGFMRISGRNLKALQGVMN